MARFSHSRVLFVQENGQPMCFVMRPDTKDGDERKNVRELIEAGGGELLAYGKGDGIRLVTDKDEVKSETCYLYTYIKDCVAENQILDIEPYKILPGDKPSSESSDDDLFSPKGNIIRVTGDSKIRRGRSKFKLYDDLQIINFILNEKRYGQTKGNLLWKDMEKLEVTHHTWHAMRDRFRRYIVPALDSYDIKDKKGLKTLKRAVGYVESPERRSPDRSKNTVGVWLSKGSASPPAARSTPRKQLSATASTADDEELPSTSKDEVQVVHKKQVQKAGTAVTPQKSPAPTKWNDSDMEDEDMDEFDEELMQMAIEDSSKSQDDGSGLPASPTKSPTKPMKEGRDASMQDDMMSVQSSPTKSPRKRLNKGRVASGQDGVMSVQSSPTKSPGRHLKEGKLASDQDVVMSAESLSPRKHKAKSKDLSRQDDIVAVQSSPTRLQRKQNEDGRDAGKKDDAESRQASPARSPKKQTHIAKQMESHSKEVQQSPASSPRKPRHKSDNEQNNAESKQASPTKSPRKQMQKTRGDSSQGDAESVPEYPRKSPRKKARKVSEASPSKATRKPGPKAKKDSSQDDGEHIQVSPRKVRRRKTQNVEDDSSQSDEETVQLSHRQSPWKHKKMVIDDSSQSEGESLQNRQKKSPRKRKPVIQDSSSQVMPVSTTSETKGQTTGTQRRKRGRPKKIVREPQQRPSHTNNVDKLNLSVTIYNTPDSPVRRVAKKSKRTQQVEQVLDTHEHVELVDTRDTSMDIQDITTSTDMQDTMESTDQLTKFVFQDTQSDTFSTAGTFVTADEEAATVPDLEQQTQDAAGLIRQICQEFDFTPREVFYILHINSGIFDDAIHWILYGTNTKGLPAWKKQEDELLMSSRQPDPVLVKKFGAATCRDRRKYLEDNM